MPNKAQFVEMLAERLDGDRKRAAAALDAMIDSVYATIARGEKVAISGFGVFERRERAARTARNPATGGQVQVAASRVPAFRPGAEFRAIASGAREFTQEGTARAQAAVSSVASRVRDAAEAVRDAPGRAAAAVKSGGKGGKKSGDKKSGDKKSGDKKAAGSSSSKQASSKQAKKAAAKSSAAKKSAVKSAPTKSTAKSASKKSTSKKSATKSASKKAPAKKTTKKSGAKKK